MNLVPNLQYNRIKISVENDWLNSINCPDRWKKVCGLFQLKNVLNFKYKYITINYIF